MRTTASLFLAFFAVSLLTSTALAQVRYTDEDGVTHWVDSLDQVPEKLRKGAVGSPSNAPAPAPNSQLSPKCPEAFKRRDIAAGLDQQSGAKVPDDCWREWDAANRAIERLQQQLHKLQ